MVSRIHRQRDRHTETAPRWKNCAVNTAKLRARERAPTTVGLELKKMNLGRRMDIWRREPTGEIVDMTCEEDATSLFGDDVRCVEARGDIFESNEIALDPVENGIFANVNMARLFGRLSSACHEQGTTVVFVDDSSISLWDMKFIKDRTKVESHLSSITGSEKFGLCRRKRDSGLYTTFPSNSCTSKFEDDSGNGTTVLDIHGPIRVNVTMESRKSIRFGRIRHIVKQRLIRGSREANWWR